MSYQLNIVGGGMVGASLALGLQDCARASGWTIRLIEAQPPAEGGWQPSYDNRSTALSHGSRRLFERLGIWTELARRAEPIRQIHVSDRGHPGSARMHAEDEGVPALGYIVENAWLGEVLLGNLDQQAIEWCAPARVARAQAQPGGYRLDLQVADGARQLDSDLLVIADGGRSGLLDQLGIHRKINPYQQVAVIANVTTAQGHAGVAYERFTETGPLALLPLSGQRSALVWTLAVDVAAEVAALPDDAFLERLQAAFGFRMGALTQVGERASYPLSLIEAEEQVRSHLVVLGNAAHSLHPIAGQGFNLSLRDAMALADALSRAQRDGLHPGSLAVLQQYLDGQRGDQMATVAFSHYLTQLFSNRNPLLVVGRNTGLLAMDLLPPLKTRLARQGMGLRG
ncbi:2-octaprenyl-6-methoxyphenyl hydroxylase [Halopseudomonas pertucinogena]|uniref:2-octaprenyl-6-methoxyphenyl hydroxylase n=1 Tax=Halopseudomonas pertucinogena TaxID=86175 RepID=A0ABQ2CRG2_9GAMM|nr:2-octaprenyl-6-methoxyphenyl hydroxylase [Halopseudomonas pertucinogena]GGJ01899.1 2-octaprenyl-6-methoxyphenyl hydroxylase [Halopseudomonas pertucinogena]